MKKIWTIAALVLAGWTASMACTSVIISGKATADGRPVMMKNRDTDCLDNRVDHYQGEKYRFIGIVNCYKDGGEVWSGMNEAGLCIMNTASYNIKNDKISYKKMDKEGELMYEALSKCASVDEFRAMLKNHKKPLLVEANFGVIDAKGGASYFEVNNYDYWEYNVNDEESGYRVQTNYSFAGRWEEAMGVERYKTAQAIMEEYGAGHAVGEFEMKHDYLLNHFARSYRHEVLGTAEDYCPASGIAVDQDFIPRRITSCTIVFEGVKADEDPHKAVMWTALGHPCTSVMVPLLVGETNILPTYVQRYGDKGHSEASDYSTRLKMRHVFPDRISNGKHYIHLDAVQRGTEGRLSLKECLQKAEAEVDELFKGIYEQWTAGEMSDGEFYQQYKDQWPAYWDAYREAMTPWEN